MTVDLIKEYFGGLSAKQLSQLECLNELYHDWNAKINVISRKDIDNLYLHHVLHSLGIAKVITFKPHTRLLDVGTGGGFPGIPLAILFPECEFRLIDSIGKKVRVAASVASDLGLTNVEALHRNALEEKGKFDFIVSRAVMTAPSLVHLVCKNIAPGGFNALPNGVLCLKGGELKDELKLFGKRAVVWNLSDFFKEDFFATKKVVYIQP